MKYLFSTILFLFFSQLQAQEWLVQYQNSQSLYEEDKLKEALAAAKSALQIFKLEVVELHTNTAAILRHLSIISFDLEDDASAVAYAQEEIKTLVTLGEDNSENFVNALNNLGALRNYRSEYVEAARIYERAIEVGEFVFDPASLEMAILKGNLAIAYFNLHRDAEAASLFISSISSLEKEDEIHFDYYNIIYNYASLLSVTGEFLKSINYYIPLKELYEQEGANLELAGILLKIGDCYDNLGQFSSAIPNYKYAIDLLANYPDAKELTIAKNNLSIDLQKSGDFSGARKLVQDVLREQEKTKTENPLAFAITATNFANLLLREGERQQALAQLNEVRHVYETHGLKKDLTYISALESISSIELSEGNYSEAQTAIDEAIVLAEESRLQSRLYSLFNQKSKALSREGKYAQARETGEKAQTRAIENFGEKSIQTALVQNTLAGIYTELGEYDRAEKLYRSSLPVFQNVYGKNHPEYATSASNYSSLLQLTGNYYSAETYLLEAVEIKRNSFGEQNPDYLTTYENLALLYMATARYTDALRTLNEILQLKSQIFKADDPSMAYTYSNLATIKKQLAEYPEAESYFKKARTIYEIFPGKDHIIYASTINNLALLYQKMGNTGAARPLFEEALKIYENKLGKLSPDYATALENLATLFQMEKNYDKARALLEEVLLIDEQILGTDHPLYSKTLNNLAAIYEVTEEYEKSKELYEKSLGIYERIFGKNHPSYALSLYNLAVLEQALDNLDAAKSYYQQVVDIRYKIVGENHPDYAYAIYGLASISQKIGDFDAAKENYEIVISKYLNNIQVYFPALSESEKSAFYGKIKPVFEAFMDFAIEYVVLEKGTESDRNEIIGELYNLQLSTKALLLSASNKVRNRIISSGDSELIALFQSWLALKENIVKSYALSKEEIVQNQLDIPAMENQANEMEKQLSLKSNIFAKEFEKVKITWQSVQSKLQPDEAAIEIIRIRKNLKNDSILYASLIVKPEIGTYPQLVLLSNGDVLEDKGFKTYKNSIVFKIADKRSYSLYWKEIDALLDSNVKNIYVSADGVYNKVNISTLLDDKNNQYVVEKYNIRLLSNTKELVEESKKPNPVNFASVFGLPKYNLDKIDVTTNAVAVVDQGGMRYSFGDNVSELPGTLTEVKNISAIMDAKTWQYQSFLSAEATEANIKKMNSPKIFHVATHGFFLEDIKIKDDENEGIASRSQRFNPLMRSGLLFAGAENTIRHEDIPGEEDGILTAYEAMNLNLDNTDIVVMSACETGLGEVKNGEGVYGLQRAFIVAGAQNLIMSLWKVNDETTMLLMSTFYNEWFNGKSKTDAFNAAIQQVKKDYPNPYFWGAFVMLGK